MAIKQVFLPVNNENVFLEKERCSFFELINGWDILKLFSFYVYLRQVIPLHFIFFLYLHFPVVGEKGAVTCTGSLRSALCWKAITQLRSSVLISAAVVLGCAG